MEKWIFLLVRSFGVTNATSQNHHNSKGEIKGDRWKKETARNGRFEKEDRDNHRII